MKPAKAFFEEEMVHKAVAYALTTGITVARREGGGYDHCPVLLAPTPFPKRLFERGVALAPLFNTVVDRVARDPSFLRSALRAAAAADPFTGELMRIYEAVYCTEGAAAPQALMLGMHRSDYMVQTHGSDDPSEWDLNQIEINTIASSFGGLSPKVNHLHRYVQSLVDESQVEQIPVSCSAERLARGLAAAFAHHPATGRAGDVGAAKDAEAERKQAVLFVCQEGEKNTSDQRILEQLLWENHRVRTVRRTLRDIYERGVVRDGDGVLEVDGKACIVAYFRAGYTPTDYPERLHWDARERIERSSAVKCPSLPYHLAGTKKVQQLLCDPAVLRRFVSSDAEAASLQRVFAPMCGLEERQGEPNHIADALAAPHDWLLKPQREGGGSLVFGEKMVAVLKSLTPAQRDEFVLMKKVRPPAVESVAIRGGRTVEDEFISEFGVYGVFLGGASGEPFVNEAAGHLLRSKPQNQEDGGVASGVAACDSPFLF